MRTAVYCATRNLYRDLVTSLGSLAIHNGADRAVLVIEDDTFPYPLPSSLPVEIINVSGQTYFPRGGPNTESRWTWMVLMRAALAKLLPGENRVLSLDVDTVVVGDLSDLWAIDLSTAFLAAAVEPTRQAYGGHYYQMGVVVFNLDQLRLEGMDSRIISQLNEHPYPFPEQDAINDLCHWRIQELPSRFNVNEYTKPTDDPRIIHFAGIPEDRYHLDPVWRRYESLCRF